MAALGAHLAARLRGPRPDRRPERAAAELFGLSGATARQRGFVEWSEELCRDGADLLDLGLTAAEWITSRSEHLTARGQDRLARTTRLEIDLPASALRRLPGWRGLRLLPITSVGPTSPGRIAAHHGEQRVQLITGRRERSLVAAGLVGTLRAAGVPCSAARAYELVLDAMVDETALAPELDTWPPAAVELVRAWAGTRLLLAAVRVPEEAFDTGWRTALTIEAQLDVPIPHDRVSLGDELRGEARELALRAGLVRRTATTSRRRLEAEHLDDVRLRLPVRQVSACGRYRFELEAPRGMVVARSALVVTSSVPASFEEPTVELVVGDRSEDGARTRIDKAIPRDWSDPGSPTLVDAHVDVVLRPRRRTTLPAVASFESAGALAATALTVASARHPNAGAALAPVLLLVGLAAAGLAAHLDRGMGHTLAATTRHRLVAGATVASLGAALAASGVTGPPVVPCSAALALAAWALALMTTMSTSRTADSLRDLRTTVRSVTNDAESARWTRIDKKLRL